MTPSTIVAINPIIEFFLSPETIAWWDQVRVAPEDNKIAVFSKGTSKGFNPEIPIGGHTHPTSTVGANELWKNAQKNEKKKHTSEIMKSNIPHRNPLCTIRVWWPWYEASLITSLHHTIITNKIKVKDIDANNCPLLYPCIQATVPVVNPKAENDPIYGQGLGSTKWKGWYWFILSIFYVFIFFSFSFFPLPSFPGECGVIKD